MTYQLRLRNADETDEFTTVELTEEEWLRWKDVLVRSNACDPKFFERKNTRMTISYYGGTLPVDEDDELGDIL